MKRLLMAMLFSVTSLMVICQTYAVGVSGFVEDVDSGEPIENQMVQVYTDSIPDNFYYFNILWTDENGFFTDSFEVPSGVSGNLFVATPGCQGVMLVEEVTYSENNTDFTFAFLTCSDPGGGGDECEAMFYYYPAFDSLPSGNTHAIQFLDNSFGNPTSWDWDFGDGNLSTEQNPLHIYADTGIYEVCLAIANPVDSCFSTLCQEVFVFDDTMTDCMAWFEYEVSELTVDFIAWSMSNQQAGFSWDFGDGTSGTGQTISHTYSEEGLYNVTMTYSDTINDCFFTYTEMIALGYEFDFEVYGYVFIEDSMMADFADVYLMTFDTIDGELVNIAETEIDGNGYYEFDEPDLENCVFYVQAELQQSSAYFGDYLPTYHYDALTWQDAWPIFPSPSGMSYNVMMVAADGSDMGDGEISGMVMNDVERDALAFVQIVLLDENGDAIAYTRTDDNGYFTFTGLAYGTYFIHTEIPGIESNPVVVSLHQDNSSASMNIIIRDGEAILGLNDPLSSAVQRVGNVFPNPVSQSATIEVEMKNAAKVTATVLSSHGNTLIKLEKFYTAGLQQLRFDLDEFPKGIYFIDISSDDGSRVVKKLVKL